MPHVSMEYVIMVPILLMQVILIPMAASWMIDVWIDKRRETALQDIANYMGTTIQQLYYSLTREDIASGTTTHFVDIPSSVESMPYIISAYDKKVENSTLVDLSLALIEAEIVASTRVTLGPNVYWQQSTFVSDSTSAGLRIVKFANGTLSFMFT